ncbi:helix-turn-helix domain-containing protein [Piscinibacter sp. XHJ-5]|uniref:helix-turn-helix domain-containing protein n=1 Tax=Piscinibacter sp. XHJ-5 TaxID=3037797 RepID=UPI0024533378|nr:helix-turn-helix domain-containing protein [Piscinibacter sp. XHJ-5]
MEKYFGHEVAVQTSKSLLVETPRTWQAKHLLEAERRTVQEVSVAVGYEDAAYFRSLFKRFTGIGPQAYRDRFGIKRNARA